MKHILCSTIERYRTNSTRIEFEIIYGRWSKIQFWQETLLKFSIIALNIIIPIIILMSDFDSQQNVLCHELCIF